MAHLLFETEFTARIHDIDAAGIMFFARYFYYAHDAYEQYLNRQNLSISHILESGIILPIVHTEADYKQPVFLNETIGIRIFLRLQTSHSFTLEYQFTRNNALKAVLQTVHVCLTRDSQIKTELPVELF